MEGFCSTIAGILGCGHATTTYGGNIGAIGVTKVEIQSTLVISTSVISNNRLSRRENLVLVLTQKSKIRLQNIVEKRRNCSWGAISPLFHNIFNTYF